MLMKPRDTLTRADIQDLVDREEPEDRFLEYKERLPDAVEQQKDNFRLDVIAFANSEGGHIVFGVEEQEGRAGYPGRIQGIDPDTKLDEKIRRLHSILDSSRVVPRIAGVKIRELTGNPGDAPVIIVEIPKSLNGPHAWFDGVNMKFYGRNSKGNFQLDYWQTRDAFLLSENLPQRARQFHGDRFREVGQGKPHAISKSHRFLLVHMFPLGAFARQMPAAMDPKVLKQKLALLAPMMKSEQDGNLPADAPAYVGFRWNIDGPFLFSTVTRPGTDAYVQVFLRQGGVIEAVDTVILDPEAYQPERPMGLVRTKILEDCLISAVFRWLEAMKELMEITPPIMLMISLRGVEGFHIRNSDAVRHKINEALRSQPENYRIDRNEIHLPEVIVDAFASQPADFLRSAFDALWQSAGWEGCLNYDESGSRRA